jgi:hypothetical protein
MPVAALAFTRLIVTIDWTLRASALALLAVGAGVVATGAGWAAAKAGRQVRTHERMTRERGGIFEV